MGDMLLRLTLLISMFTPCLAFGQFGINARLLLNDYTLGDKKKAIHAGLEYHFRLKSNRIEFHPEIGYRGSLQQGEHKSRFSSIDFDFNTSIYPFDFEGDCNCPTFSKQGNLIKKGFFFELQPGLGYQTMQINFLEDTKSSQMVIKLGAAVGLDIGISDHYTITPYVSGTRFFLGSFEDDLPELAGNDVLVLNPGLRLTYSVDDKNRRRRN